MCNHAGSCGAGDERPLETKLGTRGIDERHQERAVLFEKLDAIDNELNEEYRRWYARILVELQERTKGNALGIYFEAYDGQEMFWYNPCLIFAIGTTGKAWEWDGPEHDQFNAMITPVLHAMGFGPGWGLQGYPGGGGLFQFNPDDNRNEFWRHLSNEGQYTRGHVVRSNDVKK